MNDLLTLEHEATRILKEIYGSNATFRDGQLEAIIATMNNKRTLIVQKTGWGKSLVYFICTKINRRNKKGVTIIISPLLVLMDNQIEAAKKLGLKCDVLNSTVKDRKTDIISSLKRNDLDLLLITPETLFSEEVTSALPNINIGLFVIDEVHCISDWGHDFRLEYGKLHKILSKIPKNVPVLGTTATANDRVIDDLKQQLGNELFISRGPLSRESLAIQILQLPSKAERYAWILQHINELPGSGIIYCLTRHDCENLSKFLNENGIEAKAYYSGQDEDINNEAISLFMDNKIKVIVATIKLGMGYDKGDVGFVIHFQQPSNIVSYYQQIGRAGRNIEFANVFLMSGKEDIDIINYFIDNAFPKEEDTLKVINLLNDNNGLSINDIMSRVNIRRNITSKILSFLEHEEFIYKEKSKYYVTLKRFVYNQKHYEDITNIRRNEMMQMQQLITTNLCFSQFIVNSLDDKTAPKCGKCRNCLNRDIISSSVDMMLINKANDYINRNILIIEPRKKWPNKNVFASTVIEFVNQNGICLSKYGEVGFGEMVKSDKYSPEKRFREELVIKSYEVLLPLIEENNIKHLTFVPSLRSDIVKDFAHRLAKKLGINCVDILGKNEAKPQKSMNNSPFQFVNAYKSFRVHNHIVKPEKIILVDDVVDSRWTLTVCGYLLMKNGCKEVYPFALADSSMQGDEYGN